MVRLLNRVVEIFDSFDSHALRLLPHVSSLVQFIQTLFGQTLGFLLHEIHKAVDSSSMARLNFSAVHLQVNAASVLESGVDVDIDLAFLNQLADVNTAWLAIFELFAIELFLQTLDRVLDGFGRAHDLEWRHWTFVAVFFELWIQLKVFDLLLHQIFDMRCTVFREKHLVIFCSLLLE